MNQYGSSIDPWYAITQRREKTNSFQDRYHWGDSHAYVERFNYNTSVSYVTGSHNVKVGMMSSWGPFLEDLKKNGALEQRYSDGVPVTALAMNHPTYFKMSFQDVSTYVQDTWTIDRLSLNFGLRWESFNSTIEETPATLRRFTNWDTPFPQQKNVPKWTDVAPRLGMAYDLFGDASTAVKLSWGRYNASNIYNYARDFHPGGWQYHERDWFDCALSPATRNSCATVAELNAISPGLGAVAYGTRDPNMTYEKGVAGAPRPPAAWRHQRRRLRAGLGGRRDQGFGVRRSHRPSAAGSGRRGRDPGPRSSMPDSSASSCRACRRASIGTAATASTASSSATPTGR